MTITDVYRALWRHKILIAALTATVVAATWVQISRVTPKYEANALVRINRPLGDPSQIFAILEANRRLAETYGRIAETSTIARAVYSELNGTIPFSQIDNEISASPLPDVELLRIRARSTSPGDAVRIANAVPFALRDFIARTGDTDDQVVLVEPAARPTEPFYPNIKLTLALALFVGLTVNAGLALLRELISDPLPELDELENVTGLPVLATVPPLQFADQGRRPARSEPQRIPSRRASAEASVPAQKAGVREARRSR